MLLGKDQSQAGQPLGEVREHVSPKYNILVLCTGNSARSIIGEALFNAVAGDYFNAYSAGSNPTGKVNPFAAEQIAILDTDIEIRSKSWDEFGGAAAPELDFVITVCGNAAQEICPCFVGSPKYIHWELPDPAAVTGTDEDIRAAFADCFNVLQSRIKQVMKAITSDMTSNNIKDMIQSLGNET